MTWRKSTYSAANGACVEVGTDSGPTIAVRNSQHPDRAVLTFPATALAAFVAACASGELDHLTA